MLFKRIQRQYLLNIAKKLNQFNQNINKSTELLYIYANSKNAGDFLSAKGIQLAVGIDAPQHCIEKKLYDFKEYFGIS
jgi:hypothetical protein